MGLGGPGGMFIDNRKNVLYPPIQNGRVKCIMLPRRNHTLPPNPDHLGVKYILICSGYPALFYIRYNCIVLHVLSRNHVAISQTQVAVAYLYGN